MSSFPGGTGVTHLDVYDWSAPDGLHGGSAHVHLACTEAYVVVDGHGTLQTLGGDGFVETPLEPLTTVWFGPGVIHRAVNDGGLRVVVVMQNAGLPEAGDAVFTFPPETLADPDAYARAAAVTGEADVRRRTGLAVEGFSALRAAVEAGDLDALDRFYAAAARLTADQLGSWRKTWDQGPRAAAALTGEHLDALEAGDHRHLLAGRTTRATPPGERRFGMCGRLATYDLSQVDG